MLEISRRKLLKGAAPAPGFLSGAPNETIIDAHVRVWKHGPKYPLAQGVRGPAGDGSPGMLLALRKANGIPKTVIIQVIRCPYDNAHPASALKQDPGALLGVRRADPLTGQGFCGVRLSPSGDAAGDWIRGLLAPRCGNGAASSASRGGADHANAGGRAVAGENARADRGDRSHGGWPARSDRGTGQADRAPAAFESGREDLTHRLIAGTLSSAGRAGVREKPHHSFGLMGAADRPTVEGRWTYARGSALLRDDMRFLTPEDLRWMLSKTIQRVWSFKSDSCAAGDQPAKTTEVDLQ